MHVLKISSPYRKEKGHFDYVTFNRFLISKRFPPVLPHFSTRKCIFEGRKNLRKFEKIYFFRGNVPGIS